MAVEASVPLSAWLVPREGTARHRRAHVCSIGGDAPCGDRIEQEVRVGTKATRSTEPRVKPTHSPVVTHSPVWQS